MELLNLSRTCLLDVHEFVKNLPSALWSHIHVKLMVVDNSFHLQKQPIYQRTSKAIFLRHNRNKVALNSFLTGKLLTHDFGGSILFISVNSEIKCNSTDVSEGVLHIGHTQEEADTKIIVHVKHCLLSVVTLLLAHLSLINSPYEIEVNFNFGKDRRFYKINNICSIITPK